MPPRRARTLAARLSGPAKVTGRLADPGRIASTCEATGVSAAPLDAAGAAPLDVAGLRQLWRAGADAVVGDGQTARRAYGMSASGRVPLAGGGLSIAINGEAPLSLANRFLAERGAQLSGTREARAPTCPAACAKPAIRGTVSTAGAQLRRSGDQCPAARHRACMAAIDGQTDHHPQRLRGDRAPAVASTASGTVSTTRGGLPRQHPHHARRCPLYRRQHRRGDARRRAARSPDRSPATRWSPGRSTSSAPRSWCRKTLARGLPPSTSSHIDPPTGVVATLRRARADDGTPTSDGAAERGAARRHRQRAAPHLRARARPRRRARRLRAADRAGDRHPAGRRLSAHPRHGCRSSASASLSTRAP